ncbi:DUF3515 domain-containing protein [Actinorhabdospora filicis]|uniref:DUF3515 domain-containing protein n=1 Tax=Actinorhabdospora filicis TaxID=1785913 RepID=UPI002554D181|nr:DUF3515 domain-containing protein [Actinorhabdospora filicis]
MAVPVAIVVAVVIFLVVSNARPKDDPGAQPSAMSSAPVYVDLPKLDGEQAVACRALLAELPDQVLDQGRRIMADGSEQAAAFGDPPTTLVCGVEAPKVDPAEIVYPLEGVCWVSRPTPQGSAPGTVWTTVDRVVPVAVTVPGDPAGSGQWAKGVAAVVGKQLARSAEGVPTGCG